MSCFAADWLALREPVDARARDPDLARAFAARLPRPARLADFGAGTGANARALAPLIGTDQTWILVESDPALRSAQRAAFLAWADRSGYAARAADAAVIVTAAGCTWRFETLALDLAQGWAPLEAAGIDAVTCAAFLDLAARAWIERLAAWLAARRLPFLAALTVNGRRAWTPPLDADAAVAALFRRHQARDKGLGPAAGGSAPEHARKTLADNGFFVTMGASDWHLGGADRGLLAALVAGEAAAALETAPELRATIAGWRRQRLDAAAAGTLGAVIGHRDLLALPWGICNKGPVRRGGEGPCRRRL
ncbi:MAG TPA: class I SAM-dependent methyltransferase [Stellaceae bacterium]|nr:class I SAM-dependent methyltransferase [Stellaceae bacterium]